MEVEKLLDLTRLKNGYTRLKSYKTFIQNMVSPLCTVCYRFILVRLSNFLFDHYFFSGFWLLLTYYIFNRNKKTAPKILNLNKHFKPLQKKKLVISWDILIYDFWVQYLLSSDVRIFFFSQIQCHLSLQTYS